MSLIGRFYRPSGGRYLVSRALGSRALGSRDLGSRDLGSRALGSRAHSISSPADLRAKILRQFYVGMNSKVTENFTLIQEL